jgi:hypothetical protein
MNLQRRFAGIRIVPPLPDMRESPVDGDGRVAVALEAGLRASE